jgi:hypothetical protein
MTRRVNKRIPVADDTIHRLRAFADGLGSTYDDAINFLIDMATADEENPKLAGHRLRGQYDPVFASLKEHQQVARPQETEQR